MKWFNNLRVGFKVILCCLIFMLIISGIVGQSYFGAVKNSIMFDDFYNDSFQTSNWLNQLMKNILQRRIDMIQMSDALRTKNFKEIEMRMKNSGDLAAQNVELWKKYSASAFLGIEKQLAYDYYNEFSKLHAMNDTFYAAINNHDLDTAVKTEIMWLPQYRIMKERLDKLILFQEQTGLELKKNQEIVSTQTKRIVLIAFIVSIIMGITITLVLARSVSGPVSKGLAFAKLIADGDFTERIDLEQKDELGQLGKALNTAADDLEKMVSDIVVGSQNLVQAIQEISAGNENLSQRTSEQASSLEEVAATIEETSAAINQNAESAKQANAISTNAIGLAENGGRVVSEAVSAINEVNDASKRIEAIISVINEIAFQTNLLALNAAVEAARAGEQGRGFAVVAGEVRNLAQRSGSAAKEIGELIKTTVTKVEKGTALANKSGDALKEIVGSVKNVGRLVSEIHAASEEQKQGASQINTAIAELDSATQQNAGLVEETASASEEIANQAQDLLSTMERFKIRKDTSKNSYDGRHKELHLKQTVKKPDITKTMTHLHPSHNVEKTPHIEPAIAGGNGKNLEKILGKEGFEQF